MNLSMIRGRTLLTFWGMLKKHQKVSIVHVFQARIANSREVGSMTPQEASALVPGVIAGFVGVLELRSDTTRTNKIRNLVPVFLTFTLVIVFFSLERIINIASPYMPWLAYSMAALAV
ncbi:MAG TPA: hypothetical protein VGI16_12145, partial [Candidatus Acidoferrum sp.]